MSQHGRDGFEAISSETVRPSNHGSHGSMGSDMGSGSHSSAGKDEYSAMDILFNLLGDSDDCSDCYGYDSCEDCYGYGDNYFGYGDWEDCEDGSCLFDYWGFDGSYVTMSDYYVTDIMVAASSADSDKATALEQALNDAIVHFKGTSGETGMTGIAVTLPYGDAEFYDQLVDVFTDCGIDADYIAWLEDFVDAEGVDTYYDYGEFEDDWFGWDNFSSSHEDSYPGSHADAYTGFGAPGSFGRR